MTGYDYLSDVAVMNMVNDQVVALEKACPLFKPDPNAGNMLVDPVVIAALAYWWRELQRRLLPPIYVHSERVR